MLALWLERKFSKTQILELYLNRVYFGSGAYGVERRRSAISASRRSNVTLAEAALLAGLVKSPSRLAPTRNFDGAEQPRPDRARRHGRRRLHRRSASARPRLTQPPHDRRRRPAAARSITSPTG